MTAPTYSRLVIFDTNTIERRYLAPLLRGQKCRDLELLRWAQAPYEPALHIKSLYEICQHIKEGRRFPWMDESYPGGIEQGRRILEGLPAADEPNVFWWFRQSEEWRTADWDHERLQIETLCRKGARPAALRELEVRRAFSEWKHALSEFCERVWSVLSNHFRILTAHDVAANPDRLFAAEQDLCMNSLIPNEDFELVTALMVLNPAAFISEDKRLLRDAALSVSSNCHTAFVHPDQLREAVAAEFAFRWSTEQSAARASGGAQHGASRPKGGRP